MRVLIHTHIACRLLVEGSAPNPSFEHRIILWLRVLRNASEEYAKTPHPLWGRGVTNPDPPPYSLWGYRETSVAQEARVAKIPPHFFFRDGGDGRNGAGSTPQNTVATVASVALYSITSNAGASTIM